MTEVSLDGWCEGGLGQQRNDSGGCATVESPGAYVIEYVSRHPAILLGPCVLSDHTPMLWWLSSGEGWDAVHDAALIN